jgi:hypothetical protein
MAGIVNPAQSQGGAFRGMPSDMAQKVVEALASPVTAPAHFAQRGIEGKLLDENHDPSEGAARESLLAALNALGLGTPAAELAGGLESGGMVATSGAARQAPAGMGHNGGPPFPELADRYPETGPGEMKFDKKKNKEYLAKKQTPEEDAFMAKRLEIIQDMEKNGYKPYFDVSKREQVDPSNYKFNEEDPGPATLARATDARKEKGYKEAFDDTTLDKLRAGFSKATGDQLAHNWYFVKQMEDEFIKRLGPEAGRKAFSDKLRSIAVTTAGLEPTTNIILAHYADFMRKAHPGEPIPSASPDLPSPVRGGKYGASNNIRNYENLGDKELDPAVQPKGYSFQGDFLGREDLATFDDQMSSTLPGKPSQPELYGTVQEMMEHLAAEHGTTPANFQGVTWAGLKGTKGKPMMSHWNDMIERTSRLTGLSPEEVLDRYVHSSGPVYSGGPAATGMAGVVDALAGQQEAPVDPRVLYGNRGL